MKLSIAKSLTVVAAVALASCSEDAIVDSRLQTTTIEAELDDADGSRTAIDPSTYIGGDIGLLWTPTDTVGVFGSAGSANVAFTNDEGSKRLRNSTFSGQLRSGEAPQYAYYPWSAKAGTDAAALNGTLPATQPFSLTTGDIIGDYKYGTAPTSTSQTGARFKFRHIFSLLRIAIDATGTDVAGENLESIRFNVPGRQICGDFTFSAIDGSYAFAPANAELNTIDMTWSDTPALEGGRQYVGYITCAPTLRRGDKINVTVTTEAHQADFTLDVIADLTAGGAYTIPLRLSLQSSKWQLKSRPSISALSFTAATNPGKILDKEVWWDYSKTNKEPSMATGAPDVRTVSGLTMEKRGSDGFYGYLPYLYDRKLVPTFTVPEGAKVYSGDTEVVSGKTAVDFAANSSLRVVAADGGERSYNVVLENSGLPVVVVNQSSTNATEKFIDFKVRAKSADWAEDDKISIYNADGTVDLAEAAAGVRLRGNSTQRYEKLPFAIKLVKKAAVLGMPKHKRWCLIANYADRSMIRNTVSLEIAHIIQKANGDASNGWSSRGKNVELIYNGRHVGNYFLCEQIKIDSERVNIKDCYEDVLSDNGSAPFDACGYLLELDTNYDENCKFTTSRRGLPIMFKDDVPASYVTQMESKFNSLETYLYNKQWAKAYELLDINSYIDQWLVFEIAMNDEYKHPKSVYLTLDGTGGATPGDGKIHGGPCWDFDWETFPNFENMKKLDSSLTITLDYNKFDYSTATSTGKPYVYIPLLVQDATTFQPRVKQRWANIYNALKGQIPAFIRQQGELNAHSWQTNSAMWPAGASWTKSGDEVYTDYNDVIENMVSIFEKRLDALNTLITSGQF